MSEMENKNAPEAKDSSAVEKKLTKVQKFLLFLGYELASEEELAAVRKEEEIIKELRKNGEKPPKSKTYLTSMQRFLRKNGMHVQPIEKKPPRQEALEWVMTVVAAVCVALLLRCFVCELVVVDGNSMYPTLHHGEVMFVSKTSYGTANLFGSKIALGGEPERFDVVVCNYPNRGNTNFVKRVVGLPGDVVQIRDRTLYVNGQAYDEKFLGEEMYYSFGPYVVPEGEYFVMGDNRNYSNDSRSSNVGPIPRTMIIGRVESILWSWVPNTLEDYGLKDNDK